MSGLLGWRESGQIWLASVRKKSGLTVIWIRSFFFGVPSTEDKFLRNHKLLRNHKFFRNHRREKEKEEEKEEEEEENYHQRLHCYWAETAVGVFLQESNIPLLGIASSSLLPFGHLSIFATRDSNCCLYRTLLTLLYLIEISLPKCVGPQRIQCR